MLQIRKPLFLPNFSPRHVRIPAEKGNIPSTRSCLSSFKKRSGRKENGSTLYWMSWWIAQRLTNTVTSRRMKKPARVVSRVVGWGIAWGVSLTMLTISVKNASKQGKFGLSDNSLWQSFGTNHIVQLAMQPGPSIPVLYGIKQTPENFSWSSNRTPCTKKSRDQCFL